MMVIYTSFFASIHSLIPSLDRLQFTVTSRKEMPNAEFTREIAKAAEDLYDLQIHETAKARL